jgi:hypothetical protein
MHAGTATAIWPRIGADERGYGNSNYKSRNADYRRCAQIDADPSTHGAKLLTHGQEER